jgi:hypothetical protein
VVRRGTPGPGLHFSARSFQRATVETVLDDDRFLRLLGRARDRGRPSTRPAVAQEDKGADAAAKGVDGGEGVWKGKVDEDGLVVEGEGEVEEEVEGEPERGRVCGEGRSREREGARGPWNEQGETGGHGAQGSSVDL